MFESVDSFKPVFLTKGDWELDGKISHVDFKRRKA